MRELAQRTTVTEGVLGNNPFASHGKRCNGQQGVFITAPPVKKQKSSGRSRCSSYITQNKISAERYSGCGSLCLLRALGGTRTQQAAANGFLMFHAGSS